MLSAGYTSKKRRLADLRRFGPVIGRLEPGRLVKAAAQSADNKNSEKRIGIRSLSRTEACRQNGVHTFGACDEMPSVINPAGLEMLIDENRRLSTVHSVTAGKPLSAR